MYKRQKKLYRSSKFKLYWITRSEASTSDRRFDVYHTSVKETENNVSVSDEIEIEIENEVRQSDITPSVRNRTYTYIKQSTLQYLSKKNDRYYALQCKQLALQERKLNLQEKRFELES
ncbi:unnamed protein product [Ceutorhynchus assimilis]|uniref:Uncharacterized protein n=1 Tax=Ceutorhynchus assimilis TaxID=467358 RepID=A0A9N9QJS5_9CUCU|nr:unnamed protein product [Ceutorhynchus assimilis]